ncbi:MAG: PLxRFG domain-containing protein [Gammaproteobacteria bacterium]|nr:PLxRFG domain-containing protein [Gammaproteobacteria bacterium]
MATYETTGPDGTVYEFDGPDNATDKQLNDYVQRTFGAEQTIPSRGTSGAQTDSGYDYKSEETSGVRDVADVATGLISGTAKAAGALVGLGSLVPGLHYVADPLSAWLQKGGEALDEALLSDRQQEINQELSTRLQEAAGSLGPDASTMDYIDAMVAQGGEAGSFVADHPGQVANLIATSVPYMFGGGLAAKGIKAGAEVAGLGKIANMGRNTAAAVGEGAITSGEVTKNIIEKTGTSGEYSTDRLAAVPAGMATAGISLISGKMATKAGVLNPDEVVTSKVTGAATNLIEQSAKKGLRANAVDVAKGAGFEGGEELLQGAQEKVFENLGTGTPLLEDVGGDAVMGAFAGAGQGGGVNIARAALAKDELSEASKEAQAAILAEQAQALEDDEFIGDAGAIASTEDSRAFAVKWSKILGVSTDEVFQDPRFDIVRQQQEEIKQEKITRTNRRKAAESFPDENKWEEENAANQAQQQRLDIANEQSDLGSAFVAWQEENEQYDTNDNVIEAFLSDPAVQDLLPEVDDSREPYFAALDAHSKFKDVEANRTPEEQAQVDAIVAPLIDALNVANSDKNLGGIAAVEQTAREQLDPAEWAIAKRNNAGPKKGKAKAAAKPATPGPISNEVPGTTEAPVITSPYKENSKKDLAHKEATEALGDLEAYPEITKAIESKKGVYGSGETLFSRTLAKAKVKKRLAELGTTTEGGLSKDKSSVATKDVGAKIAAAVASGEIELTNTQVKVLDVILDAIETDTLGEYFYGDGKTGSAAIAKAAGLKGRSTADAAVKSIMGYFTEFAGEGTKEQLKATKLRTEDGKTLGEASVDNEDAQTAEVEGFVPNENETKKVVADADETSNDDVVDVFDHGMGSVAAGGTRAIGGVASPDKKGKALVAKNAEVKGKTEDQARINKSRKGQEGLVSRVMGDKGMAKQIQESWDESKPEEAGSFNDLHVTAKYAWINAVGLAMEKGDPSALVEDAQVINDKFSNQKGETPNAEPNKRTEVKDEKVVNGQRKTDRRPERAGATADGRGKKSTETVRKPKVVQQLEAGAKDILGALWASEYPHLKKILTQKKYKAFESEITDIAKALEDGRSHKSTKDVIKKEESTAAARDNAIAFANKTLKSDDWFLDHPTLSEMLQARDFPGFRAEVSKLAKAEKKAKAERKESFSDAANAIAAMRKPKATAENNKKAMKFDSLLSMLFNKGAVPKLIRDHFHFVDTVAELNALFPNDTPTSTGVGGVYRTQQTATGLDEDVVFVMENIEEGTELALFLHEVGVHLGLESLFSDLDLEHVIGKIETWMVSDQPTLPLMKDGSLDPKDPVAIAGRVSEQLARIRARAKEEGKTIPGSTIESETIAYFIQYAVEAGVEPSAVAKQGSVENIAFLIVSSFRKALQKLGMSRAGVAELTVEDLLDLSLGAAREAMDEFGSASREISIGFKREARDAKDLKRLRKDANQAARSQESINPKKNKKDLSNTRKTIKAVFGDTGIQHWETFSNIMKRASNENKFLHQFIEENKIKMPGASIWFNLILKAEETANQIKRHVEGVAVQAREMSDERLAVVNKFIADSTLDRAWGYDPKFKGRKVKVDKEMSKRFDALRPPEQQLVKDVFAHGETMIQRKRAIAKAKGVSDAFFHTGVLDGPYAPLKRFGSYVTTLKSGALIKAEKAYELRANKINKRRVDNLRAKEAHFVVKFFDTIGEASRFKKEKKALYESATTTEKIKTVSEGNVSNHKVLSKVLGTMKASNIDPTAYKAMESLVQEMYMSSLDESNARESQAKREGIAGFESNMIRSFLSHSRAEANLISQMEHGADIAAALVNAEQEAKTDPEELVPVYNMLVSHYTSMLEGKETPIANTIAAFNTVWMLTSSVGYHFTNATQPLMVTVPVLAATFGDYKGTMKALLPMFGTGYQVARDVVTFKKQNGKFLHRQAEIDFSKLDPKYKELFKMLQDRKLLDVGMEQDLAEFTRLNTGSDVLNKASGAASDVTHRLYQAARVVEMYNRVSTAVAAHDMAIKQPGKIKHLGMTPSQFAMKIVQDTQGDFSNTDAPRLLKRLPKLMVQYRKYQFMMGWVYANAAKAAWAGSTAEEKAVGYKTLRYMLMHAGMFGGVRGLPFIGVVAGAFSLFSGGEEPEDIERIIGKYIDDPELANLISRGLPSIIGIDMSTKLSQDKIFHPAPFIDLELSQEGLRDAFFGTFLGPTGSTASSAIRSAEFASEGNAYRAVESAMPKGIKTIMESWRIGTEGYSLRNGDLVADPSHFSKLPLLANALGIPAADLSKIKWTYGQQYELKEYFSEAQSDIRNQYMDADEAGDFKKMAVLETEFHELQDAKDKVRPFFNNDYKALKRTSIRSLLGASRKQGKRERNSRRSLGTE